MIAEIRTSLVTGEVCVIPSDGDGFALYACLDDAGLSDGVHVGCFGEYENCVVFERASQ
jgi:hypothetical protein